MSTLVTPKRQLIYFEGAEFRSSVSEELIQRQGSTSNFINLYQHDVKEFRVNGNYGNIVVPFKGVDGLYVVRYNMEIVGVAMYSIYGGTSGTTEFDIKYSTTSNGAWTSIFSTTPKIQYNAHTTPNDADKSVEVSDFDTAPANTTAPVVSIANINQGWSLRMDLIQHQLEALQAGLIIYFRPR